MSVSIENLDEDLSDEEENFSTKQLFLFAWQIAKGMVTTLIFWIMMIWFWSQYNLERRIQNSAFYKHEIDGINKLVVFLDISTVICLIKMENSS